MTYPSTNEPYGTQQQPYGAQQQPYGAPSPYGPQPTYASWIQRVGANLVDSLVVAPFALIAGFAGIGTDANGLPKINALYFIMIALGMVVTVYNRCFLAGKTGQSWGKKVLNLRLVGEQTGQPIGAGTAFVRDLAHLADMVICFIGYLFPLWDAKKQTIADKLVKTLVVR